MANAIANADVLEFMHVCTIGVQSSELILHALVTQITAGTPTDQMAAAIQDAAMAAFLAEALTNQANYHGCSCRILNRVPPLPIAFSTGGAQAGTSAFPPLPPQCRGLISWQTANAGRAFRGRSYIAFPSTGFIVPNTGGATVGYVNILTQIKNYWAQGPFSMFQGGSSMNIVPVIYHRKAGKNGIPPAKSTTPIVSGRVSPDFATQRRSGYLGRANAPPF